MALSRLQARVNCRSIFQAAMESKVYKKWDDGFVVRAMTTSDALVAQGWFSGICPTSHDLSVALQVHRKHHDGGFYVGEYEGELVASAIRIPWTPTVFYGSYFYVVEKHRRGGFGRRLRDDVATPYVGNNILCIDAHDELLAMNKKRGYTEGFRVTRYQGQPVLSDLTSSATIKQYDDALFDSLIAYDDKCFIAAGSQVRRDFLKAWVDIKDSAACLAFANGNVVGYGCLRPSLVGTSHLIGPLYADSKDIAKDLIRTLIKSVAASEVTLDICMSNIEALHLAQELRLKDTIHMIRMHMNGDPQEYKQSVFGLTSIDVCGF